MNKIGKKIIIAIALCSTISVVILGVITSMNYLKVIQNTSKDELKLKSVNTASDLNVTIGQIESSVNSLAYSCVEMLDDVDKFSKDVNYLKSYENKIEPVAKKIAENTGAMGFYVRFNPKFTPATSGLFYADTQGNGKLEKLVPTDFSQYDPEDVEHVGWYYIPIKKGKATWLNPYVNANINTKMISYVVPLYKDGKAIGVVGMDINFKVIEDSVKNTKAYKTGYGFLINENNDFLYHPSYDSKQNMDKVNNKNYSSILEEIKKSKSGFKEYNETGEGKTISYAHLNNGWIFCIVVPTKEIYSGLYKLIKIIIALIIACIIVSNIIAYYMGKIISKPIVKITEIIDTTGNFDLVEDPKYDFLLKYKDEIGIMTKAIGKMRKELRILVKNIKDTSKISYKNSSDLANIVACNAKAMNETASTVQQIAVGATEQAKHAEQTEEILSNLAENINSVVAVSKNLKNYSQESKIASEESMKIILDLKNKFQKNIEVDHEVSGNVLTLHNKSGAISEILNVIEGIAQQTNLLALNASIEAARAGENGRSFAVVAHEIQNLSEQTSGSAKEIESIIEDIQNEIKKAKKNMDIAEVTVNNSQVALEKTNDAFKKISEVVMETINEIDILIKNVATMDEKKEKALVSVRNIHDICEESAASTEQLSATVQEETAVFHNISETADKLKEISTKLKDSIDYFKVN